MARKILTCLAGAFLIAAMVSCTKLSEAPTVMEAEGLQMELSDLGNSIPLNWGELIAVSSASLYSTPTVQLWFKDKQGNIFMVPYDVKTNKFYTKYRHIKRG